MPRTITINYARVMRTHVAADLSSYTADYTVGHLDPDGHETEYTAAILQGSVTVPMAPTDTVQGSFGKLGPAIATAEQLDFSTTGGDKLFLP